jgi:hypothetical protein
MPKVVALLSFEPESPTKGSAIMKMLSVVGAVGLCSATAMAADLPKQGTYNGTYTAIGTYKATKIGDRTVNIFDENGVQVTNGFADHMTFHCWGTNQIANGESASEGHCVATDPTGDLLETRFSLQRALVDKIAKGSVSLVAGTGKFAGVSGTSAFENHVGEFRALTDGTYVTYVTLEGNYKLP